MDTFASAITPRTRSRLPLPFPVQGIGRPRLRDQGRDFIAGITGMAPGTDIGIRQPLRAMFHPRDLREVKAGQLRELTSRQTRILADLAEPTAEGPLGPLCRIGHVTNCRLSRRPVVLVRNGELPHCLKSRRAQFDITGINGGGEINACTVTRIVVKHHQAAIEQPEIVAGEGEG
jgi:hypothetical protein